MARLPEREYPAARYGMNSYRLFKRLKNSSLVFALDLIAPSMQLVVVDEAVFWTPRMTMHR